MKLQLVFGREGLAVDDYIIFGMCIVVFEYNIGIVLTKRR